MACAAVGNAAAVGALLAAGAIPDAQDELGNTAMLIAAMKGHDKCVESFIQARAEVNLPRKVSALAPPSW